MVIEYIMKILMVIGKNMNMMIMGMKYILKILIIGKKENMMKMEI
jgi:hypothetical protein